jgi:hypothetical protein
MTRIDDQTLMAFADGELNAAEAALVRKALEHDAALRDRLEKLHEMDGLLRAAITPGSEMPSRFAALLKPAASVVPMRRRVWIPAGAAIAAGLAVWMLGTALLSGQASWLRNTDDGVAIAGPLAAAAATAPSGKLLTAGDLRIRPVVSFVANDGRPCRELHVRETDMTARVIACRNAFADTWFVEALANVPAEEFGSSYETAGAVRNPVIDAALARLGVKATMGADDENAAIARKWTAP